jgi:hypothetical protein
MKSIDSHLVVSISILLFFIGGFIHAYFFADFSKCPANETFKPKQQIASSSCPDKLKMTRGNVMAFRTTEEMNATNPHVFPSLAEYHTYAESMNSLYGCPILSPETSNSSVSGQQDPVVPTFGMDIQSKFIPTIRGIDPIGYYDWKYTIHDEKNRARKEDQAFSDMPGDPNWGGPAYTEYLMSTGKYKGSDVVLNRPVIKYPTFT